MSEKYHGMSPNEQIEMMQRVRTEIADLRRVISVTQPKAQAYDLLERVLGLLPRKGQGMSEDIDWMLKRKVDQIDKAMMEATVKKGTYAMTTAAGWLALAEKARMAKGPDSEISFAVMNLLGFRSHIRDTWWRNYDGGATSPYYSITASIDVIVALIEKHFPGKGIQIIREEAIKLKYCEPTVQKLVLALVAAFCEAKAAQAQAQAQEQNNAD